MTVALAQKNNRRVDRKRDEARRALGAMKKGAALHLFYERGRAAWRRNTGIFITPEVAEAITHNPNVMGVGDSLFATAPLRKLFVGQIWRQTMSDKPQLELVENAASDDPFDLSKLRVSQDFWKPPTSRNCSRRCRSGSRGRRSFSACTRLQNIGRPWRSSN